VTRDGRALSFGRGREGQLGTGRIGSRSAPGPIDLGADRALAVAAGDDHSVILVAPRGGAPLPK
jgi:alpha-tubulin suppressor-like RCC1 family protein